MAVTINASTSSGLVQSADTSGQIELQTNGTTVATVNTSNNVQFRSAISVGNATPTTSGAGITFPATQSASTDANTLDDYEEGSWTPAVVFGSGSATLNNSVGSYTKIGRVVTVNFNIAFTSASSAANPNINNLPFSQTQSNQNSSGVVREYATTGLFWGWTFGSSTTVYMQRYDNNNTIPNGTSGFSGTYTYFTS